MIARLAVLVARLAGRAWDESYRCYEADRQRPSHLYARAAGRLGLWALTLDRDAGAAALAETGWFF